MKTLHAEFSLLQRQCFLPEASCAITTLLKQPLMLPCNLLQDQFVLSLLAASLPCVGNPQLEAAVVFACFADFSGSASCVPWFWMVWWWSVKLPRLCPFSSTTFADQEHSVAVCFLHGGREQVWYLWYPGPLASFSMEICF